MNVNAMKNLTVRAILPILILLLTQQSFGIWITRWDEHFDNDQAVNIQRWPWNTPFQDIRYGWHYNPLNPYRGAEGAHRSNYSWGWQNFIFNVEAVDRAENPGAIWCAYTNLTDINNPRWPEDEDYMNGQIAWMWWGPWDLRGKVAASMSWWMMVDLDHYSRDSLSVVIFSPASLATIPTGTSYTLPNFRRNQPFGALRGEEGEFAGLSIFNSSSDGWVRRSFNLDDLRTLNADGEIVDSVSYLGRNNVYVGFVWNSDTIQVAGKGAFIDDVTLAMDDGLFDLSCDIVRFGYHHEEAVEWSDVPPTYAEETLFAFEWEADGSGETPAFIVRCTLDGATIFEEERQVEAGLGRIYRSETQEFWRATSGRHQLVWTLDPVGAVEESIENNNSLEVEFEVPWTPPPTITFVEPARDTLHPVNILYEVVADLADSNETDTSLACYLYWTKDTSGFAANPAIIHEWNYIGHRFDLPQGQWSFRVDFSEAERVGDIDVGDIIFIAGLVSDPIPGNVDFEIAVGKIEIDQPVSVSETPLIPDRHLMISTYPNPFNGNLRIEFSTGITGSISLDIFDLAGRKIERLIRFGQYQAGNHIIYWNPKDVGAGVYLVRLESPIGAKLQKVVYTP